MKKTLIFVLCLFGFSAFAATPTQNFANCPIADLNSPTFCQDFRVAAHCYCGTHMAQAICNAMNMTRLYQAMMDAARTRDLSVACQFQRDVPYQICVQHWSAYWNRHCE